MSEYILIHRGEAEERRSTCSAARQAATQVFAESGLGAPTASISARASVSEGSFFTYFKTKDELINELYRDLRQQLADTIRADFPHRAGIRERLEHVWSRYVLWGAQHPIARRSLKLVSMSHAITDATARRALASLPTSRQSRPTPRSRRRGTSCRRRWPLRC